MKYIKKKTYIVFADMKSLSDAVDFMLHLGKPFNTIVKKPVMIVSPMLFKRYHLDLTFNNIKNAFSSFDIKQS